MFEFVGTTTMRADSKSGGWEGGCRVGAHAGWMGGWVGDGCFLSTSPAPPIPVFTELLIDKFHKLSCWPLVF